MTNQECQIAQLQELCRRTLEILDSEDFWDNTTTDDGFYHASLKTDLEKASKGKEFKMFIEGLVNEIFDDFKSRTCDNCKYGEPVLSNTRVWCRGYTPFASINGLSLDKHFGCNKFEPKDK